MRDFKNNVQLVFQFTSNQQYLSHSICSILLYDICSLSSFRAIKSQYLAMAQSHMLSDCSFMYLLGNKMDSEEALREVPFEEA